MSFSFIFMGSCPLSLTVLRCLWAQGFQPSAVFTAPPKPKGRKQDITKTPVHEFIDTYNTLGKSAMKNPGNFSPIDVFTPETLSLKKDPSGAPFYYQEVMKKNPKIFLVASYGLLLPQAFLDLAPMGALNVHPSLLPQYRGSSPVPYGLMFGDTPAFSLMKMVKEMDAGPVFHQEIFPHENKAQNPQELEEYLGAATVFPSMEDRKDEQNSWLSLGLPLKEKCHYFSPEEWEKISQNPKEVLGMQNLSCHGPYKSSMVLPRGLNTFMMSQFLAHRAGTALVPYFHLLKEKETLPVLKNQNHEIMTLAPKLTKDQGALIWTQDALTIERKTLALNPWPKTWAFWIKRNTHYLSLENPKEDFSKDNEKNVLKLIFSSGISLNKEEIRHLWLASEGSDLDLEVQWKRCQNHGEYSSEKDPRAIPLGALVSLGALWKNPHIQEENKKDSTETIPLDLLQQKASFGILCKNHSFFVPLELCVPGKKPMTAKAFSLGYHEGFYSDFCK